MISRFRKQSLVVAIPMAFALLTGLSACSDDSSPTEPTSADVTKALQDKVQNIVVIYAENRSFDNLYGKFPGAHGLNEVFDSSGNLLPAYVPQKDRDGTTVLASLPQTWGGVTASGQTPAVTQAQSANLLNKPFAIESAFTAASGATLTKSTITRDLYHRFFENQMQLDGGKNDGYAAWADAGGLTMGHFETATDSALYKLAQQYVLADEFFQGAYGGSFLNHQYLICACAPEYPNADDPAGAKPTITVLNKDATTGKFLPVLTTAASSPASAMDGPPVYVLSGNIAPKNYFGDGTFRAVNTMQPPYQPSSNAPASTDTTKLYADTTKPTTLPPQTQTNIGDLLTAKSISWKWYAGAWDQTLATATGDRKFPTTAAPNTALSPDFQFHHQPFNFFKEFDPTDHAADRAAHLQDYNDLVADAKAGTLPAVSFYKPQGNFNQHEGYASVAEGDAHIADLVTQLQASPQWKNMVIVITYDEFGGVWDHVAPPKGDLLGPGTRIPALVISPIAKMGTVDHTPYDTGSVLRLITRRYGLDTLPGITTRDTALVANGAPAMGDLTNALNLVD